MKEEDVKNYIGEENWDKFKKFMAGQTVGLFPNGETDYYKQDVYKFCYINKIEPIDIKIIKNKNGKIDLFFSDELVGKHYNLEEALLQIIREYNLTEKIKIKLKV